MRATGTIDQLANGKWRLRFHVKGKRETIGFFATEGEAEAARLATLAVANGTQKTAITVADYCKQVLRERRAAKETSDPGTDEGRFAQHIENDDLGLTPIKLVRRRDVEAWLGRMQVKKVPRRESPEAPPKRLSHQTIQHALNLLRVCLGRAERAEVIRDNPARLAKLPKRKTTGDEWTALIPAEQTALIAAMPPEHRTLVRFSIGSGLRAGEVASLRLADVHADEERPYLHVRYGQPPDLPTKGGRPRRVPLFGMALKAVKEQLRALRRGKSPNPHGLLFPRPEGEFRDPNHLVRWDVWKAAKVRAGITRRFRWHDLRHTCGSSLVCGWWGRRWTLIEVRDMLGHSSVTTTERYAHLAESALDAAAEATRDQ